MAYLKRMPDEFPNYVCTCGPDKKKRTTVHKTFTEIYTIFPHEAIDLLHRGQMIFFHWHGKQFKGGCLVALFYHFGAKLPKDLEQKWKFYQAIKISFGKPAIRRMYSYDCIMEFDISEATDQKIQRLYVFNEESFELYQATHKDKKLNVYKMIDRHKK